jgi:hypothetical protein
MKPSSLRVTTTSSSAIMSLDGELALVGDDLRAALVAIARHGVVQLLLDDGALAALVGQDLLQVEDQLAQRLQLLLQLVALQARQPLQAHFKDGLGLDLREPEAAHQAFLGDVRRGAGADER